MLPACLRSSSALICDRLLRNKTVQASCSSCFGIAENCLSPVAIKQWFNKGLATGAAAEPEWQESGIRGAKEFDVSLFPQDKARCTGRYSPCTDSTRKLDPTTSKCMHGSLELSYLAHLACTVSMLRHTWTHLMPVTMQVSTWNVNFLKTGAYLCADPQLQHYSPHRPWQKHIGRPAHGDGWRNPDRRERPVPRQITG